MARPKGSKNKTKKATAASSRSKKNNYDAPMMGDEVAIIITFAISAFLFLSNLGLCGPVGAVLKSIQLGLFGIMGYLFPIVLSFVVVFILSNLDNPYATLRMTAALFMLIFISAIFQLTFGGGVDHMSLTDFYSQGAEQGVGGGVIGGALAMVLHTIAGGVGAMLILLVACFVCLIYITGKPLARMLAEHSGKAAIMARDRAREDWNNVTTSARIHKEERRLAREAHQRELASRQVDFTLDDPSYPMDTHDSDIQQTGTSDAGYIPQPALASAHSEALASGSAGTVTGSSADSSVSIAPAAAVTTGRASSAYDVISSFGSAAPDMSDIDRILGPDEHRDNTVELPLNVKHTPVTLVDPTTMPRPHVVKTDDDTIRSTAVDSTYAVSDSKDSQSVTDTDSVAPTVSTSSTGSTLDGSSYDAVEAALDAAFARQTAAAAATASSTTVYSTDHTGMKSQDASDSSFDSHSNVKPVTGISVTDVTDDYTSSYDNSDSSYDLDTQLPAEEESSDFTSDYEDDMSDAYDESFASDDGITINSNGKATIARGDMEQGTRRIVASNGQIIDADVEPISKKIETQLDREKRENTPTDADNKKVEQEIKNKKPQKPYIIPPLDLLKSGAAQDTDSKEEIRQNAIVLQDTLKSFGVNVTITNISVGPAVTRYELQPDIGVKVSKIVSLTNDIKMRLAAADIRIEAPIPGKSAVGIEVPNKHSSVVYLGDVFRSPEFTDVKSKIAFGVGKDIAGKTIVTDIAKMPHLLIAGATGSGKSVCINTLIMSMLYKYKPEEVRMIMVDPKVVELSVYNGIPHLLIPVVTDPKKAAAALNWAVAEMTDRYKKFAESGSRDLKGYNEKIERVQNDPDVPEDQKPEKLPQIVIIIDELADLMMVSSQEVEDAICRIAQLARAAGMHLVIATQRPTVDVITGLIKANVPSRIAFAVSSGTDSRTIIDMNGAEKLLGKGDMLFFPQGIPKPVRVQGAFVSDQEVSAVTDFIKKTMGDVQYSEDIQQQVQSGGATGSIGGAGSDIDELFSDAGQLIIESDKASIGMLQRKFRIGFNRAARIMDQLADAHVVGPEEGTKPRKILMSMDEFNALISQD